MATRFEVQNELEKEAVQKYNIPERVVYSASAIITRKGIVLAKVDENGEPIMPSKSVYAVIHPVAGRHNHWLVVKPQKKFCNCQSEPNQPPCVHRLAVWMHEEIIKRMSVQNV